MSLQYVEFSHEGEEQHVIYVFAGAYLPMPGM